VFIVLVALSSERNLFQTMESLTPAKNEILCSQMICPSSSLKSQGERKNEPAITDQHKGTKHPQEYPLHNVRLRGAKQTKRSNSSRKPGAAAERAECGFTARQ
jgi:hypothetical protein